MPEPGPGQVLLRVTGSGVCHSDLHLLHSEALPFPMTLGHEPTGEVVAIGPDVVGFEVGEHVICYIAWGCGVCRQCATGAENACEHYPRANVPGPGLGYPGAMAEYLLAPARSLVPLGGLDPVDSAPLADAALTPYHAIDRSRALLTPTATVVVIGVGGLGHMAVQILRAITGSRIVAVDVDAARLEAARGYGADETVTSNASAPGEIMELTRGVGADVVLDFVGAQPTLDLAAAVVSSYGHLTVVGLAGGAIRSARPRRRSACPGAPPTASPTPAPAATCTRCWRWPGRARSRSRWSATRSPTPPRCWPAWSGAASRGAPCWSPELSTGRARRGRAIPKPSTL